MPAVVDDGQHDVVALRGRALALGNLLHPRAEAGNEPGLLARLFGEVELSLAALQLRAGDVLLKLLAGHHVHNLPHHRGQFGDVDELGKARHRLVFASGVLFEF